MVRKIILTGLLLSAASLMAAVYALPEDILQQQFPGRKVKAVNKFVMGEIKASFEERFGRAPEDTLFSFYRATKPGQNDQYGIFVTHPVRTKKQTFFMKVDADGQILNLLMVSFYEPPEYVAADNWLSLFSGRSLSGIQIKQTIPQVSGATLTSRTMTRAVKENLYLLQQLW